MNLKTLLLSVICIFVCMQSHALMHQNYAMRSADGQTITVPASQITQFNTVKSIIQDFEQYGVNTQPPAIAIDLADLPLNNVVLDAQTIGLLCSLTQANNVATIQIPNHLKLNILRAADWIGVSNTILSHCVKQIVQYYRELITKNPVCANFFSQNDVAVMIATAREHYLRTREDLFYPRSARSHAAINEVIIGDEEYVLDIGGFSIQEYLDHGWDFRGKFSLAMSGWYELDLSAARINSLQGLENIPDIAKVHKLGLSYNLLSQLPAYAFASCPQLLELLCHNNNITTIDSNAFSGLEHLSYINLSSNAITIFNPACLVDQISLKTLMLSGNKIQSIAQEFCSSHNDLQTLDLNSNELSELPSNCFICLHGLQDLNLSHNKIEHLLYDHFVGLDSLAYLNLANNELKVLPDRLLAPLQNLNCLNISHNLVFQIPSGFFVNNRNMQSFDISHNRIKMLPVLTFNGLALRTLKFNKNQLTYENIKQLEELLPGEKETHKLDFLPSAAIEFEGHSYDQNDSDDQFTRYNY